ncbi:MlaC/ttg2D family ABC transporter substrate-binding protein [Campylobacter gastrosuis]|uniref:ABC transporter substrate-binding protein n=1 Tax=Campylobacter gastrosuis TaxID=2974576 RepID=A0ABT7HN12_9BACT|nr:ABC transporter substrate-binding protein [Campylobacter gastrosuis]MDL0087814.1 ABC transporter substrate-binding protein [Campylobacter gastrosuis]MDL0088025.1 ABC transporter substrate-binding protein [Campylobacter gastrosuis]
MRIFLAILMLFSFAFGINKDEIKGVVESKTNEALTLLDDKNLDENAKLNRLFAIFDPLFDYKQMAKISLAKRFNNLSQSEQEQFSKAFEIRLKNSYIDKIKSYSGEKIIIKNATEPQKNRYFLSGELVSGDKTYDFVYKFYDAKERGWLIYDIDIIGVSIIQTYRSQFADMLENADFATLMAKLNEKN